LLSLSPHSKGKIKNNARLNRTTSIETASSSKSVHILLNFKTATTECHLIICWTERTEDGWKFQLFALSHENYLDQKQFRREAAVAISKRTI